MTIESPAAKAIRLLGVKRIAGACDLTTDAVRKWAINGGRIPASRQLAVLSLARERGVDLSAEDILGIAA
jgi:hypothetical protein